MDHIVTAHKIYKSFSNKAVLKNIKIELKQGQKSILLGANGSGKSTFLKILSARLPYSTGQILIKGQAPEDLKQHIRNHIVYICSRQNGLYPHLSIKENIYFFQKACGLSKEDIDNRIEIWKKIDAFKIALETSFSKCSKGMKQISRIFIQTMHSPEIILLDEPFSGLDENNKELTFKLMQEEFKNQTILMATHDKDSSFFKNYSHFYLKDGQIAS